MDLCSHHDLYICLHPRKAGYLIYCADCYEVAEGATEDEAKDNWRKGQRIEINYDNTELVDGQSWNEH